MCNKLNPSVLEGETKAVEGPKVGKSWIRARQSSCLFSASKLIQL